MYGVLKVFHARTHTHTHTRCTVVNFNGMIVFDKHVKIVEPITDYRGLDKSLSTDVLLHGEEFATLHKAVSEIIKDRIIIGHSLSSDFEALRIIQPMHQVRDTAYSSLFCPDGPRPLKSLVMDRLGINFEYGVQTSVRILNF